MIINCKSCEKNMEVPNKRFKLCSDCKHQNQLKRCKEYKINNKQYVSEYNNNWKYEHKDVISEYNKEYNIKNRKNIQERQTNQHRERRKIDMKYKMSIVITNRLKKFYNGKPNIKDLIGISISRFVEWIEYNFKSDMNWENHGTVWHLDHVIPCEWFDLTTEKDRKVCFHWSNVRPLDKNKNMIRKATCTQKELINHEILAIFFEKNINFEPLITKLLEKFNSGLS